MAGYSFAGTGVPVAPFKFIQLRGGGHVVLHHGATQHVTLVKGSTQFTSFDVRGNELTINACNANCPNHYDLEIDIVSPAIDGVDTTSPATSICQRFAPVAALWFDHGARRSEGPRHRCG